MTEREQKQDALEQEFRELEEKCVECINKFWMDSDEAKARGVNIEIDAEEDSVLILSLDNDGVWNASGNFGECEIGKNPSLIDVLDVYALVDKDEGYLLIVLNPEEFGKFVDDDKNYLSVTPTPMVTSERSEQRIAYLEQNKERLADGLFDAMQNLLDESK